MIEETYKRYLRTQGYSEPTVYSYWERLEKFLLDNPQAANYTYKNVLDYFGEFKKEKNYKNQNSVQPSLAAIKKYYDCLVYNGVRNNHPCRTLYLKQRINKEVIHQDLFSSAELEKLLDVEINSMYKSFNVKYQVIISFLIYQGLTAGEILKLKVKDVDLDKGLIYIKGGRHLTARFLEIAPRQYPILYKYMNETRKRIIREETEILVLGKTGKAIYENGVTALFLRLRMLYPERNLNAGTVRQSVVANWLNEKGLPLEQVQMMAGHRWISSTGRYRYTPLEEERDIMNQFFPIK